MDSMSVGLFDQGRIALYKTSHRFSNDGSAIGPCSDIVSLQQEMQGSLAFQIDGQQICTMVAKPFEQRHFTTGWRKWVSRKASVE